MTTAALAGAALAFVVAAAALVVAYRLQRRLASVPTDGNVVEMLRKVDNELGHMGSMVAQLEPRLRTVERHLPRAIAFTGIVSYDAFGNITGNLSRSIALLNARGDGVVISLLVGRTDTLFFTKQVRGREGVEELSPEEREAVAEAMAR
jgi:hypothetical protein